MAIANAQVAYARYRARFAGERWAELERLGARPQRPLWASTGTKDPALSDVVYVERLIAPGVINTMPEQTLRAFAEHGNGAGALDTDAAAAEGVLAAAAAAGVDLAAITAQLECEGVQSFGDSYAELVGCIASNSPRSCPQPLAKLTSPRQRTRGAGPDSWRSLTWRRDMCGAADDQSAADRPPGAAHPACHRGRRRAAHGGQTAIAVGSSRSARSTSVPRDRFDQWPVLEDRWRSWDDRAWLQPV